MIYMIYTFCYNFLNLLISFTSWPYTRTPSKFIFRILPIRQWEKRLTLWRLVMINQIHKRCPPHVDLAHKFYFEVWNSRLGMPMSRSNFIPIKILQSINVVRKNLFILFRIQLCSVPFSVVLRVRGKNQMIFSCFVYSANLMKQTTSKP